MGILRIFGLRLRKLLPTAVMLVLGCAREGAPPRVADSTQTANTVRQMHGKEMRTFRGPADILGDTTKNARKPAMIQGK
jgi:hypothetical protein